MALLLKHIASITWSLTRNLKKSMHTDLLGSDENMLILAGLVAR